MAFQVLIYLDRVSVSLCLSLLVLTATHSAPAEGKSAHHLWLMLGYKTLWKRARKQNDKDQIGILTYLLPSAWTKCVERREEQTQSKGCCQVFSFYCLGDTLGDTIYYYCVFNIWRYIKVWFCCCELFLLLIWMHVQTRLPAVALKKFKNFRSELKHYKLVLSISGNLAFIRGCQVFFSLNPRQYVQQCKL